MTPWRCHSCLLVSSVVVFQRYYSLHSLNQRCYYLLQDAERCVSSAEVTLGLHFSIGILELKNSGSHIVGDFICADLLSVVLN
jgi:hypothetical protein